MAEKDYEQLTQQVTELTEEVERLKKHADTLLGEKKQAAADAQSARDDMESMRTELQAHRDAPVNDMFDKAAPAGMADYLRSHFDKYYSIEPDEEGRFHITKGNDRIALLTAESLKQLPEMTGDDAFNAMLIGSRASGSGAVGSKPPVGGSRNKEEPKAPKVQFGLQ